MREIKFRAWCGYDNTMIHINAGIGTNINGLASYKYYDEDGKVVEAPLMQFTGTKDGRGVEIYESDIVLKTVSVLCNPNDRWGGVKWVKRPFIVKYHRQGFTPSDLHECEIIGNIHENPELMDS